MPPVATERRAPEIAVAVPSHERPLRLRWLLNSLEEQTLPRERWEVVVGHDSGPETRELLRTHPLARDGTLREAYVPPGTGGSGDHRNLAWRGATAPIVAFVDDDCRVPPDFVANALEAARRHPGAVVQGSTQPDPDELHLERAAPHTHTRRVNPPTVWAHACNIIYPRELLEELGGYWDEPVWGGEDTDLALRAQRAGRDYVGAPEVLAYHAVVPHSFLTALRWGFRWGDLALMVKRHPELREHLPMWVFWKRTHVWLGPAAIGAILAHKRGARWAALALPYLLHAAPQEYGTGPRGRIRVLAELPARAAVDAAEMVSLARGSARFRTFIL
jgi:GT2 family glycosyltransferase